MQRQSPNRRAASRRHYGKHEVTDQCMRARAPAASLARSALSAAVGPRGFPPRRSGRRTCSPSAGSGRAPFGRRLRLGIDTKPSTATGYRSVPSGRSSGAVTRCSSRTPSGVPTGTTGEGVLDARANHPGATLAHLYDPDGSESLATVAVTGLGSEERAVSRLSWRKP